MSDKNLSHQRGTNPPTRDANAAQRAALAVRLRASKMTYEAIAHQAGYANASSCRKAVQRELDRCVVKNVETLRMEELNTLDMMQAECMALFLDRKNTWRLTAADRILAIMERRARLMGLDTPIESATAANMVVIREVPQNYLGEPSV